MSCMPPLLSLRQPLEDLAALLTLLRPAAISWLFFRLGLSLPHIIAGENLNMPILGPVLSKCGAVFIRRSFGDDPMYSTVVKEYIEELLENGKNSGSLPRTGKNPSDELTSETWRSQSSASSRERGAVQASSSHQSSAFSSMCSTRSIAAAPKMCGFARSRFSTTR